MAYLKSCTLPPGSLPAKLLTLALLASLPLLSGCLSMSTIQATQTSMPAPQHDFVERIERASITRSNTLLICFEARLNNSSKSARYTVIVPMSDIHSSATALGLNCSNRPVLGSYWVKRAEIAAGWEIPPTQYGTPVFVGPPIPAGADCDELIRDSRPLSGTERTIFVVAEPTNRLLKNPFLT